MKLIVVIVGMLFVFLEATNGRTFQTEEFAGIIEAQERSISSIMVNAIEEMKSQMPCGWPQYGIPPLAPYKLSHKDIHLDGNKFNANGQVNDFVLVGLNEFIIRQLKNSVILRKITWDFIFPSVNFTTDYQMDMGTDLRYKRNGGAFFALEDLVVKGQVKYAPSKALHLKEFKVYVSVGKVHSKIENLSHYKIINRKLNEIIEEWFMLAINENTDYIAELSNDIVVPMANNIIGDQTVLDLIEIIGNAAEPVECVPPISNQVTRN